MAPGTNIGSATPIGSGGEDLDAKVRNDAAAFIAALADETGRNAESYRAMVTDALNLTSSRPLDRGVADTIQPTLEDFVAWLDGRPGPRRADRDGRRPDRDRAPSPGTCAALRGADRPEPGLPPAAGRPRGRRASRSSTPGAIVPARRRRASACCSRSPGSAVLPFQWDGHRPAGARRRPVHRRDPGRPASGRSPLGGIVALVLGGRLPLRLDDPALEPSTGVIVATAAVVGRRLRGGRPPRAARAAAAVASPAARELVGEVGRARVAIGPGGGSVLVNGEIWSARPIAGVAIPAGGQVRVVTVHMDDLTLTVEPREG